MSASTLFKQQFWYYHSLCFYCTYLKSSIYCNRMEESTKYIFQISPFFVIWNTWSCTGYNGMRRNKGWIFIFDRTSPCIKTIWKETPAFFSSLYSLTAVSRWSTWIWYPPGSFWWAVCFVDQHSRCFHCFFLFCPVQNKCPQACRTNVFISAGGKLTPSWSETYTWKHKKGYSHKRTLEMTG